MVESQKDGGAGRHDPRTLAGMLAAAVDMEEQIGGGVYADYLKRENWPAEMEEDIFETIQGLLTTLLDETKKHKQIIAILVKEYGHDQKS